MRKSAVRRRSRAQMHARCCEIASWREGKMELEMPMVLTTARKP